MSAHHCLCNLEGEISPVGGDITKTTLQKDFKGILAEKMFKQNQRKRENSFSTDLLHGVSKSMCLLLCRWVLLP